MSGGALLLRDIWLIPLGKSRGWKLAKTGAKKLVPKDFTGDNKPRMQSNFLQQNWAEGRARCSFSPTFLLWEHSWPSKSCYGIIATWKWCVWSDWEKNWLFFDAPKPWVLDQNTIGLFCKIDHKRSEGIFKDYWKSPMGIVRKLNFFGWSICSFEMKREFQRLKKFTKDGKQTSIFFLHS